MEPKKLLIIASDAEQANIVAGMFFSSSGSGIVCIVTSHGMGVSEFLKEKPDFIAVCDYSETHGLVKGFQTYHEIKEMSAAYQLVVRVGYEAHAHHDYMKLPKIYSPFGCGGFFEMLGARDF